MRGRLNEFVTVITKATSDAQVAWSSSHLKLSSPSSSRIQHLVQEIFDDQSGLAQETVSFVDKMSSESREFPWDVYFRSYDKTFGCSSGYQGLVKHACEFLQAEQTDQNPKAYLDAGAGTGNFSIGLLIGDPLCNVLAVDLCNEGLQMAQAKADLFARTRLQALKRDILIPSSDRLYHGIVMNNVLYTLSKDQREDVLKTMFRQLEVGGRMFLSDPLPFLDVKQKKEFVMNAMLSAKEQDAPMTEFDIALVGIMNKRLLAPGQSFLSRYDLVSLACMSGFNVCSTVTSYYGCVTSVCLEKTNSKNQ